MEAGYGALDDCPTVGRDHAELVETWRALRRRKDEAAERLKQLIHSGSRSKFLAAAQRRLLPRSCFCSPERMGSWVCMNGADVRPAAAEDQSLLYAPTHNQK